jgi:hypothetical protein
MKYNKPAVAVGLAAGILSAAGSIGYSSAVYHGAGWAPMVIGALGILLAFDSLLSLVGPKKTFYGLTIVSVLIVLILALLASEVDVSYLGVVLALTIATAVLSFLAARFKSGLTEQSNPMNLPVFG